jgi:hypothetical protein
MAFLMIAKIWISILDESLNNPNPIDNIVLLLQMLYFLRRLQKKNKKLIFSCPWNKVEIAKLPYGKQHFNFVNKCEWYCS